MIYVVYRYQVRPGYYIDYSFYGRVITINLLTPEGSYTETLDLSSLPPGMEIEGVEYTSLPEGEDPVLDVFTDDNGDLHVFLAKYLGEGDRVDDLEQEEAIGEVGNG